MPRWLRSLPFGISRRAAGAAASRLIVGSTGSGKSEGEMVELVRSAERRDCAVVLLDGHGPLALRTAGHWAARGHEARIVYEPLHATDRVLCWDMLPKSVSPDPSRRRIEDDETREELVQCFLAQRNLATVADRPLTKEWLEAAITLCLCQPSPEPLASLVAAFRVGSPTYERLLGRCERSDVAAKFRDVEQLKRRNAVQYDIQTGAGRRLVDLVCDSEVVRLRSRIGPFAWLPALRGRTLIAFDGGGIRSREIKRTVFLLASMQVIHAVRRHFAETQTPLPVVLVLEEAGALGLVTPFVLAALQELRKAGLALHIITQSSADFGDHALFESVLANCPWVAWHQSLSPADQDLGAKVLSNTAFDAHSVHYTRPRQIRDGVKAVATGRGGTAFLSRYRLDEEPYFKSPSLQEQEFRTALATLRVGERFVRDRQGVRKERVTPLRTPRPRRQFDAAARAAVEKIRTRPLYLPAIPTDQVATEPPLPDAASRLRGDEAEGST